LTRKLSDKDKKDWENFLNSNEKVEVKDSEKLSPNKISQKTIDLHGYTLEEANIKITSYIDHCFQNKVKKINVITGKGLRSKNYDDPYQSKDLSILKYSVPEFIKNNPDLMKKIFRIDFDSVDSPSKGNFEIILKSIK
jgi:DNA-nicking Smr family endonuclease|tara:strand:- start:512 stop:925 length:414 start_codon:yes stop_codon:yes gene_type:complete